MQADVDPQIPITITAIGTAVGMVLSGVALLYKSRAPIERAAQLLRRLYDWLESHGVLDTLPPALRGDLAEALGIDDQEEET